MSEHKRLRMLQSLQNTTYTHLRSQKLEKKEILLLKRKTVIIHFNTPNNTMKI